MVFVERAFVRRSGGGGGVAVSMNVVPREDTVFEARSASRRPTRARLGVSGLEALRSSIVDDRVDVLALASCTEGGVCMGSEEIECMLSTATRVSLYNVSLNASAADACSGVTEVEVCASKRAPDAFKAIPDVFGRARSVTVIGNVLDVAGMCGLLLTLSRCVWLRELRLVRHGLSKSGMIALCTGLDRLTGVEQVSARYASGFRTDLDVRDRSPAEICTSLMRQLANDERATDTERRVSS